VVNDFKKANEVSVSDSHTNPSVICCMPKMNGMPANIVCEAEGDFLMDTMPIVVSTAPAVKLAVAEKHIG
jgi:hypothetical protein